MLLNADLREAKLSRVLHYRSVFAGARFRGANVLGADLRGADLTGARELSWQQLTQARTDETTILPNGTQGHYRKHSNAERPVIL